MGVVYEAEQISLGRRVALKVLPLAAAMDPKQMQRFQLEAHAAACLHHTSIVPVHAVGCERGVPFYAMQFIEGRSLAQLLAELRRLEGLEPADQWPGELADVSTSTLAASLLRGQFTRPEGVPGDQGTATTPLGPDKTDVAMPIPSQGSDGMIPRPAGTPSSGTWTRNGAFIRTVAQFGVQVAEALDHAHTRGILHRDIKPGNLLLDDQGQLWVTDFGLAQIQGNPGLTLSGDILGTLRYMSPEQALAKRVVIDGRTDIYSLGVTLYQLLTLRPAFDGKDRQEILRKIAAEEPAPPRKLNAAVPRDLETILLKTTAKEPAARYATAKELADELRRFLDHKPIKARRSTAVERAWRWHRRNGAIAALMWSLLVALSGGLAGMTWLYLQADAQRREAQSQRLRAEASFRDARKAVDDFLTKVGDSPKLKSRGLEPLRRELLESALGCYKKFVEQGAKAREVRLEFALAHQRIARVEMDLGKLPEAIAAQERSTALLRDLVHDDPHPEHQSNLAVGLDLHAEMLYLAGRMTESREFCREALEIRRSLAGRYPFVGKAQDDLNRSLNNMGCLLIDMGRPEEGDAFCREAIEKLEQRALREPSLARNLEQGQWMVYGNRARSWEQMGRLPEALRFAEKALSILVPPEDKLPEVTNDALGRLTPRFNVLSLVGKFGLVQTRVTLGGVKRWATLAGRSCSAIIYGRNNAAVHRKKCYPGSERLEPGRKFRWEIGRLTDAETTLRDAMKTDRRIMELNPDNPEHAPYRQGLADALVNFGLFQLQTGRGEVARELLREATVIVQELSRGTTLDHHNQQHGLAQIKLRLAAWPIWEKRHDDAARWLRESEMTLRDLVNQGSEFVHDSSDLARVCHSSGTLARQRGGVEEAIRWFREAVAIEDGLVRDYPQLGLDRQRLAEYLIDLADALRVIGQRSEARKSLDMAANYFNTLSQPLPDQLCGIARFQAAFAALNTDEPAQAGTGGNAPARLAADEAMRALQKAIEAGHRCPLPIDRDPLFEPIRSRDEFRALVRRLEGDPPAARSGR
jgi:serine/threonine protein kinase